MSEKAAVVSRRLSGVASALRPTGDPTSPHDLVLRFALAALVAILTLLLFPPQGGDEVPPVRVGMVAPEDVIAPFDFRVEWSEDELNRRQGLAGLTVPPVFAPIPSATQMSIARVEAYLDRFEEAVEENPDGVALESLGRVDGVGLGLRPAELRDLAEPATRQALRSFVREAVPALFSERWFLPAEVMTELRGSQVSILESDGDETVVPIERVSVLRPGGEIPELARHAERLEADVARIALQLLPGLLVPNLESRPSLTAIRRDEARRRVSPTRAEVLRGELIVGAHTRVTAEQEQKLAALKTEMSQRRGGLSAENARAGLGALAINAAILGLLGFYFFLYRRDVFDDMRSLVVLTIVWTLVTGLAAFTDRVESVPSFVAPVALASVLVAVLWDTRLAAVVTVFLCAYLAGQGGLGLPLLWTGLLGGLCGAWSVRRVRRRTHFYETLLFIAVGHLFAIAAIALMRLWGWGDFGSAAAWGFLSAAIAVFVAMGLMPILEWVSGRTTDLTLLELADLNRPLLKQLLLDAPGTYHHSIIVGHLAEVGAEATGANSLLARVGSYYHDIGKANRPEYFVENQRRGINPHDHLDPRASARIVSRHVPEGVDMARAANLPDRVIDFIREHHGTTRLSYFWHKAGRSGIGKQESSDFRYPGPLPRSKETAIVMLADSVEAASRLVPEPIPEKYREMVRRIIEMKLAERQLDEADLTFQDLAHVEESFVAVLSGMHHHRLDYPTVSLHEPIPVTEEADSPPTAPSATGLP
ncbi:MAG: HD family phosphohydrolase [Gemmatimonadota bacterium]